MSPETVKMEIPVPQPPSLLPAKLQEQWKKTYATRYQQAITDEGRDFMYQKPEEQHARRNRVALREANRILAVPECTCYKEAAALEDWQCLKRVEENGVLKVVTIDGKKFVFPVPGTDPDS